MKKSFVALVAVAAIATSLAATPASAQRYLGAAIAGGLIGGAIVGGAIAASPPPPPPPYAYGAYGGPAYVEGPPPGCRFVRERFWDGYDWRFRRVEVCN
jgi:hypothetical protein